MLGIASDQAGHFACPPFQQRFDQVDAEKAVGTGNNDLVYIAQLRQRSDAQLQLTAGIAFGLRIKVAGD
ncbi:hypothetical protein D3C77_710740 [compost metagenome]